MKVSPSTAGLIWLRVDVDQMTDAEKAEFFTALVHVVVRTIPDAHWLRALMGRPGRHSVDHIFRELGHDVDKAAKLEDTFDFAIGVLAILPDRLKADSTFNIFYQPRMMNRSPEERYIALGKQWERIMLAAQAEKDRVA